MRRWIGASGFLALVGCFTEGVPVGDTDPTTTTATDTGTDSASQTSTTGGSSTTDASSTATSTESTSTAASTSATSVVPESDTSGDGSSVGEDPGTGTTSANESTSVESGTTEGGGQLGPRLVRSIPAHGESGASLQAYFYLYFDRVVSPNDATGHILVSQAGGEPVPVAPLQCPPDNDPTCIAAVFPSSFRAPGTEHLPGNTLHHIIVERDFPDPDGVANTEDQIVEFTTLDFSANAFNDSTAINDELGGVTYDPVTESLYLFGSNSASECVVRRVPFSGGVFGSPTTVATPITAVTGQSVCYGASLYDGALFVALTYEDMVIRYNDLSLDDLSGNQFQFGPETSLPDIDGTLGEVWSIAASGDRTFFAFGNFHGGVNSHSILEYSDRTFSVFNDGSNLWTPNDDEVVIAVGSVEDVPYLFAYDLDQIHKFRLSDGARSESIDVDSHYGAQLLVDDVGRLYLGHGSGLIVYDAASLEVIRTLSGFAMSRFAIVPADTEVLAVGGQYRAPATLSTVTLEF